MSITSFAESNLASMGVWALERASLTTPELKVQFDNVMSSQSPPQKASYFAEFIYANRDSFTSSAMETAADICDFATSMGFNGLGQDQRGLKIAAILRGSSDVDEPEPLAQFSKTSDLAYVIPAP